MRVILVALLWCSGVLAQDCQHPIVGLKKTATGIALSFDGNVGSPYSIETNSALGAGWAVKTQLTALVTTTVWTDTTTEAKMFYRVSNAEGRCASVEVPAVPVSGVLPLPVSAYSPSLGVPESITLSVDSVDFTVIPGGSGTVMLPTGLLSNGVHQLRVRAIWPNGNDVPPEAVSAPVSLVVSNLISLQWYSAFVDNLPIQATLTESTNWQVQVTAFDGTPLWATNGIGSSIDVTWESGSAPGNTQYVVNVSIPQQGFRPLAASGTVPQSTFVVWKEANWQMGPIYLSRQIMSFNQNTIAQNELNNIINLSPPGDVVDGGEHVVSSASGWTNILNSLRGVGVATRATQWYHIGHSHGPNTLGNGLSDGSHITATNVAKLFGNTVVFDPSKGAWVPTFKTPLQFAMFMACDAGNGDWPNTFGILKMTDSYSRLGLHRRGFVGFTKYVSVTNLLFGQSKYDAFVLDFWTQWIGGGSLGNAIIAAEQANGVDAQDVVVYGDLNMTYAQP